MQNSKISAETNAEKSKNVDDISISQTIAKSIVMSSISRIPNNFYEYDGEEIMSNFDREIIRETEKAIKGQNMFSRYPGWNFNGKVWWQLGKWNCEVWCYGSWNRTFNADTLEEIMSDVSNEYGYD